MSMGRRAIVFICFITYCRWWARAAVGVLDVGAGALGQLVQEECALEPELLDAASQAGQAQARGLVVLLDLVGAPLELEALPAVSLLDRGRERGRYCYRGFAPVSPAAWFGHHCVGRT